MRLIFMQEKIPVLFIIDINMIKAYFHTTRSLLLTIADTLSIIRMFTCEIPQITAGSQS